WTHSPSVPIWLQRRRTEWRQRRSDGRKTSHCVRSTASLTCERCTGRETYCMRHEATSCSAPRSQGNQSSGSRSRSSVLHGGGNSVHRSRFPRAFAAMAFTRWRCFRLVIWSLPFRGPSFHCALGRVSSACHTACGAVPAHCTSLARRKGTVSGENT